MTEPDQAEADRATRFIREVIVWTPSGGHTLGCNCGAYWCERRRAALEAVNKEIEK